MQAKKNCLSDNVDAEIPILQRKHIDAFQNSATRVSSRKLPDEEEVALAMRVDHMGWAEETVVNTSSGGNGSNLGVNVFK